MTDRRSRIQRSKRRTALAVYATTAALFAIVSGSLGLRMAQGQDPGLGALNASVTRTAAHSHHKSWTTAKLRTTTSGHVVRVTQPGTPGGSATAGHRSTPATHHREGHDA